ncbi:MAG: hypothetical protein EBX41_03675, partial [Chitinophagia bacterium]|nr:hypothetical protein [Chitinophagia bacterium]
MKKIFIKLFFAAAPLILLMLFYVIQDPFKVVWHYNKFYEKEGIVNVVLNNEYISTENFLNNYKNYHYDSYIFGNSRSRNYEIEYWKTKINTRYAYHFDASNENLYGIERKLAFLSNRNLPIKNALLVIDDEVLSSIENPKGHVFRKHPAISGESWFSFEMLNFQDFVNFDFITQYCHFLIYKIPENSEKALTPFLFATKMKEKGWYIAGVYIWIKNNFR